eukprot:189385-Prorocentrum_minimum.AAC.1
MEHHTSLRCKLHPTRTIFDLDGPHVAKLNLDGPHVAKLKAQTPRPVSGWRKRPKNSGANRAPAREMAPPGSVCSHLPARGSSLQGPRKDGGLEWMEDSSGWRTR